MIWLLVASAWAAEPPPAPEHPEPVPGECALAYPMQEGAPVPEGVLDGRVVGCSGVLVPTSRVAGFMLYQEDAELVRDLYRVDTTQLEDELAVAAARVAELEQPVPWLKSPSGQRWIGVAEGLLIGSATALVVWRLAEDR